ncbi:hypothetical protein BDD12DRAFT_295758 [Trichophaea hybrida]|nr:hypothetical protein BDD12DRAFT_295758 [Trichophaea hybrida]
MDRRSRRLEDKRRTVGPNTPIHLSRDQAKWRHKPGREQRLSAIISPPQPRTLRLSEIPTSVKSLNYDNISIVWNAKPGLRSRTSLHCLQCRIGRGLWLLLHSTRSRPHGRVHFQLPADLVGSSEASTIAVDCDFDGIKPLYHPPALQKPTLDIIAVSGLSAHAFGSWKSPDQSHVM